MYPIDPLREVRTGSPAVDAQPLRILLVEDDEEDQLLLRDMLQDVVGRTYLLECVDSVDAALVTIERGEHDVYLVDYRLGARDGAELLRLNGQRPHARPVIMLTGSDDPALDRELQHLGAADYLVKGSFNAALLDRSIRYALERQKVLDVLQEGEARYRALFDGNPLPMWVQALDDGQVLAVNEAALRSYGYNRAAFLALHPARDLVTGAHRDGSSHTETHRRSDGRLVEVAVTVHDLAFEGRAARLVVAEDLTQMNQLLRLAARNEATLRAVLEDSADALLVVGQEDEVLYFNAAARRMFGAAAAVGLPVPLPGPWLPGRCDEVDRINDQGEECRLELHVSATDWDGQPARLLALRDLTERRSVEEGLLLSRLAMESSANGIVIADARDPRQPLIYVNPAFERITGYQAGEVLGSNCRFLQGSEVDQPELKVLREALSNGQAAKVVLRNFRKDGTPFWNDLSISPVRNAAGTVTHFVGIQNDITERREQEAEMLHRMTHDRLTGLPVRNQVLLDRLRQDLVLARRHGRTPAMLYLDLDQFKEINDTLGQPAGDLVLVEVVRRLRECLAAGDALSRIGGDEFLVLLPDLAQPEDAAAVAGRLLEALAQPYELGEHSVFCSCSIGVARVTPTNEDPLQLIRQADLAMHAAKRAGRNNVQFYRADLSERSSGRLEMRTRLQTAIARQEFELHYQPQMDVAGQRICGLEALVRWRHPTLGQISPGRFIPVAEETGQIVAIGEWVLNEACRQHRQWLDHGLLDGPVAVNVSGVQFQRVGFVEQVEAALARHDLPGDRLELELTESVMMDTGGLTMAKLERLRELGVRLAIDDFGTGFSSLAYLKRMPIDKIKIDRSFVNDITHDSNDASITLSVIAIAHHLRMKVVAEGVETPAQLSFLKRHLCDHVQGYLIARPLPAAELERFLAGFRPPGAETAAGEAAGPTLLLVDDEPNILRALTRTLRRDGYRILTAGGAAEAFEVLAENEVHVIVSDQRMPKVCGTDFLSEVKSLYPDTVRLVLSGYTDLASVTEAINRGAIYRFLTKPWVDEQLRSHVREAFVHQQRRLSAAVLA